MSSTDIHLVHPRLPTALANQDSITLPAQDLFTNFVNNAHVYPARLDLGLFKEALSQALSVFPHAAGRLIRNGDVWQIHLNNSPVPVTVASIPGPSPQESSPFFPFPSNFAIQPDHLTSQFIDTEPLKWALRGQGTEPLLRLKLTFWDGGDESGGTVLGVSWNHTLGDAHAMHQFSVFLSEMYQSLVPSSNVTKLPPAPSLERHFFPSPASKPQEVADEFRSLMPHLSKDYEPTELFQKYGVMMGESDPIQLRISGETLDRLLTDAKAGNASEKLTVQDALSAYLVTVLNRCYDTPVRVVVNAVNYRSPAKAIEPAALFTHPRSSSNCIFMIYTSPAFPTDSLLSLPAIARAIRRSINLAREPAFIENWITFGADFMRKSANSGENGRHQWFFSGEGEVTVNSNYRFNWNDAHYGYPQGARFYTAGSWDRYFRVFTSNPDAQHPQTSTPAADVGFRVRKDLRERVVKLIQEEIPDVIIAT